ncbi:MAG: hypothetical protein M3Y65_07890 [Pseudomonadota bacterium]|nr:hypothetical protein [Pseudomonadota bacterium]
MLAAIPFQGFAAASMLTCAPAVHVQAAAMAHTHCDDLATATITATDSPPAATATTTTATATPPAGTHDSCLHHHGAGKCNTCASCCFGAVMAPPVPSLQVPGETPQVATFPADNGPVATVDLALPERPPKASLT